jgi:5-methylcytosine-specific restriction endonuclease McrA
MSIIALLNQIREGEVVLPAIQRDFVWPEVKIERLLDSVMRGYPIGITLLWETYLDVQHRRFIGDYYPDQPHAFHDNSQKRKLKLVLDGQQRLQSLYIALYGSYAGKRLYFDVLSGRESDDLSDQMYVFSLTTPAEAEAHNAADGSQGRSHLIAASELYQAGTKERTGLVKRITSELKLADEDEDRLRTNLSLFDEMLTKSTNTLKVSVIDENLPSDSASRKREADVLEIFVRVNREGTPLSRSDLIFSMLKLGWKEAAESLPDFVRTINEGNSLGLDADFVIRCLFAVSDLGTKFDIDLLRKRTNVEKLRERFDQCCHSIRSGVDFVVGECGIANASLLGGTGTLVPLVYYLYHAPKHTVPHAQVERTRKSIFLFAFAKPYSRYAESRLSAFIRNELQPRAEKADTEFPFSAAVRWVNWWEGYDSINERMLQSNTSLTHHVVQRLSGVKQHHAANAPQLDHIFPRSKLKESPREYGQDEINHFANFWILAAGKNQNKSNKRPADYFQDVPDGELQRALIDRDMLDYRMYRTFLDERAARIIETVQKRIGFTAEDFASVASGGQ